MSTLQIGEISVTHIDGGRFRLDGGAMFGVVPRPVWEPLCPTDDRNRIPMACNCLLLRCAGEHLLVETGCGDRFSEKERDIFAIGPGPGLLDNLRAAGVDSDEISHVVLTHLHFDHAAGSLAAAEDGSMRPAFANAVYWVQRREFEDAVSGHSIMRTSYAAADLQRLADSGRVRFLDGDSDMDLVLSGVQLPNMYPQDEVQNLIWLENDGAQNFARRIPSVELPPFMITLDVADVDQDGIPEVFAGSHNYTGRSEGHRLVVFNIPTDETE